MGKSVSNAIALVAVAQLLKGARLGAGIDWWNEHHSAAATPRSARVPSVKRTRHVRRLRNRPDGVLVRLGSRLAQNLPT